MRKKNNGVKKARGQSVEENHEGKTSEGENNTMKNAVKKWQKANEKREE